MKIGIDMDEVLADFFLCDIQLHNQLFDEQLTKETLGNQYVDHKYPEKSKAMRMARNFPGHFLRFPPLPHSQEVVERLSERHELFIVSSAIMFPNSMVDKLSWLEKYFPVISKDRVVFTASKYLLDLDVLIDDHVRNFDGFKGVGILFSSPHNAEINYEMRCADWLEVEREILRLE
ncbi:5'(3')-deoxyribonucleotidase [Pilibacter termitis]|uniref:5'(3')-deoxyribonucleotidase n=1 Tax=Pilibacter termitis TaxID=263852 RepID=A0A1T4N0U5_9ENTE|nr:hypothetical protein [Pilibacter termitis]SJZ72528.1 5'(3')-deoxyribonucleotidase [Pilibacter termitis]